MPLIYVKRKGWKYGKTGKLYRGKGARTKARTQGVAIRLSKIRRSKKVKVKGSKRNRSYIRKI